jgi:hypothetical protein
VLEAGERLVRRMKAQLEGRESRDPDRGGQGLEGILKGRAHAV